MRILSTTHIMFLSTTRVPDVILPKSYILLFLELHQVKSQSSKSGYLDYHPCNKKSRAKTLYTKAYIY